MPIQDTVRQRVYQKADSLSELEHQNDEAVRLKQAAEERLKRAGTEISKQRAIISNLKRELREATDEVTQAQDALDELERQRSEALERLIKKQQKEKELEQSLKNTQLNIEKAFEQVNKEKKHIQETEANLNKIRSQLTAQKEDVRKAILQAVDIHLKNQADRVQQTFTSQDERERLLQEYEAYKKARHENRAIGDLCDQRDEILKMLNTATVPGVRKILQDSVIEIEKELTKYYPSALEVKVPQQHTTSIEELYYYVDEEGKVIFILPALELMWNAPEGYEMKPSTTMAMQIVWSMIKGLNLSPEDGEFRDVNERTLFCSNYDIEDVTVLQGFKVQLSGSTIVEFILSAVPNDIQEAFLHETAYI